MKSLIVTILLGGVMLLPTFSCNKILDKYPLNAPSDVTFLSNEQELNLAVNGVYNNLWYSISVSGQIEYIMDAATDIGWDRNSSLVTTAGQGLLTPATSGLSAWWEHLYSGIARANFVLDNISRVTGASQEVLDKAEGQVRFLRAYWYSQLMTLWGGVPLVVHTQEIAQSQVPRNSVDEIIDFLLKDLDVAAGQLPESWGTADRGRATRYAAMALKSRIALMGARYDVAAAAAQSVIDAGKHNLNASYEELFQYKGEHNKEILFEVEYQYGTKVHVMPTAIFSRNAGGNSTKVPTQSLVDSYECIDGLTIDQSPYYDPKKPFENRDPRLKQTIAVPGEIFLGYQFETHKDSTKSWNYNVTPAVRITNQDATNPYATFTGYCWRKTADATDLTARNSSSLNFILIRYAEVLLNYAEAKIELDQTDASCLAAINAVRLRPSVNMPPIAADKTQEEMRTIIRRERKIELAMEGLRLQDIRRWKIAEKVMPGPLYGRPQKPYSYNNQGRPVIDNDGVIRYAGYSDKLSVVETRIFNAGRDYLWPIPQSEMDINKQLVQNPGY